MDWKAINAQRLFKSEEDETNRTRTKLVRKLVWIRTKCEEYLDSLVELVGLFINYSLFLLRLHVYYFIPVSLFFPFILFMSQLKS